MKKWQRAIHDQVLERDGSLCADCGRYSMEAHHIVKRGYFGKRGERKTWAMRNMVCLCPEHHKPFAHTKAARKRHLEYLRERYGYSYDDDPWRGMLA